MKNFLFFSLFFLFCLKYGFAQDFHTNFNTFIATPSATPKEIGFTNGLSNHPSAVAQFDFDLAANTPRGMLMPRMTTAQRTAIAGPADGLIVYDTDMKCFYYWDASIPDWVKVLSSGSASGTNLWSLTGTTIHPSILTRNVGINTITANSTLSVNDQGNINYGTYSLASTTADGNTGVFGESQGFTFDTSTGSRAYGVRGSVPSGAGLTYGVRGDAINNNVSSNGRAYGVFGSARNSTPGFNYGVYGQVSGTNEGTGILGWDAINYPSWNQDVDGFWAGYFVGRGYFLDDTGINKTPTINKFEVFDNDNSDTPDAAAKVEFNLPGLTNRDVPAVLGINDVEDFWGIGVRGKGGAIGVNGINEADGSNSGFAYIGVQGDATYTPSACGQFTGIGTYGRSANFNLNQGIRGEATDGNVNYGVYGEASSTCSGAVNYAGYFNGNVFTTGSYLPSDSRLKKDIKPLKSAMDKIMALRPSQYEYNRKKFNAIHFEEGEQYGFIAQELQEVFPTLVKESVHVSTKTGKDGKIEEEKQVDFLAVNYVSLIPVLTKGIQEQQNTIEDLHAENEELKTRLENLETAMATLLEQRSTSIESTTPIKVSDAALQQNQPNPFEEWTDISYFIPQQVEVAHLQIADASGKIVQEIAIATRGEGKTTLDTSILSTGNYYYTLVLDGRIMETKQMTRSND